MLENLAGDQEVQVADGECPIPDVKTTAPCRRKYSDSSANVQSPRQQAADGKGPSRRGTCSPGNEAAPSCGQTFRAKDDEPANDAARSTGRPRRKASPGQHASFLVEPPSHPQILQVKRRFIAAASAPGRIDRLRVALVGDRGDGSVELGQLNGEGLVIGLCLIFEITECNSLPQPQGSVAVTTPVDAGVIP